MIRRVTMLLVLLLAGLCFAAETLPPSLRDFTARVEVSRAQLPLITRAAEAAAARKVAHPDALLNITYHLQPSFAEELLNRSGGLAEALPSEERPARVTPNDFVVFSIRSWEADGEKGVAYLKECRQKGWMIILFASSAGRPADLEVDWFIDNGAKTGTEADAAVNSPANALNGWLWVCEYTAALTRLGKHPGILQSITTAGSIPHDHPLQDAKERHLNLFPCAVSVPAGDLARLYLRRVERMLDDLAGAATRGQLDRAAAIIAGRLRDGKKVFVSTNTHIMLGEMDKNCRTPWTPLVTLRNMKEVLAKHTQPGDLFFWLAFNGVSIWYYADGATPSSLYIDYDTPLRASKVDLITCFARDPLHPENNGDYALAHIEQNWAFGDSEVPVPFYPGRIAPISGLYQSLLYRMLDDVTSAMLQ
ncbi:MAG: hypothetical protein ACYDCO_05845 [Armatimonadota bacterium]